MSTFSSQTGKTSMFGFRNKRLNVRSYKRQLWNASNIQNHHRSIATFASTGVLSAANNDRMAVYGIGCVYNNFWSGASLPTGGGGQDGIPAIDSEIYIRGGISTLRIKNTSSEPLNYVVYLVRFTKAGFTTFPSDVDLAWDPTLIPADERFFRVKRTMRFTIEAGDANTLSTRLRSERINQTDFNNGMNRDYWFVCIGDFTSSTYTSTLLVSHNMSFTYDRYG